MKKNRITQRNVVFYRLLEELKGAKNWIPAWAIPGEVYIEELRQHGFVSYEGFVRMYEVYSMNPGMVERRKVQGRSGAQYYEYRISSRSALTKMREPALIDFYNSIRK